MKRNAEDNTRKVNYTLDKDRKERSIRTVKTEAMDVRMDKEQRNIKKEEVELDSRVKQSYKKIADKIWKIV